MKSQIESYTIKPFKNRNGAVSYRVAGWLLGERIRKNFKTREQAIIERGVLQLKQAQAQSDMRVTSTFLTEPQLREAEAAFTKLKDKPRALSFYLNFALENHHEPKTTHPLADAVVSYLAEREKDVAKAAINIEPSVSKVGMRRLVAIQPNLAAWLKAYPLDEYPIIPPKDKVKNVQRKHRRHHRHSRAMLRRPPHHRPPANPPNPTRSPTRFP